MPEPVERPNLRKQSVAFSTIAGVTTGAIIGAALFAGIPGAWQLTKEKALRKPLSDILKKEAGTIAVSAIASGGTAYGLSSGRNSAITESRPYIEKLEQQRDDLISQAGNVAR
jgi:hypothetical protein